MPHEAALKLAEEKGLDLIEIAPTAQPPVAKIISFDKFRYRKEKELKKQKSTQKIGELKEIRISVREAKNDLQIKTRKIEEFLGKNHRVVIAVTLRGREKMFKDFARQKLEEFLEMITVEYKIVAEPKFGGKGLIVQIIKK
jgi:translation initiation factor IF-3